MIEYYNLVCYAGRDLYDHSRRIYQVGIEASSDFEDLNQKANAYKTHCQSYFKKGEYAWAILNIVKMTVEGSTIVHHWAEELPLKHKIKLNEQALESTPKKQTIEDILHQMDNAALVNPWHNINNVGLAAATINAAVPVNPYD